MKISYTKIRVAKIQLLRDASTQTEVQTWSYAKVKNTDFI